MGCVDAAVGHFWWCTWSPWTPILPGNVHMDPTSLSKRLDRFSSQPRRGTRLNLHPSCPALLHPKGHRQLCETITVRRKSLSVGRRTCEDTVGMESAVPNPCVIPGQQVSAGRRRAPHGGVWEGAAGPVGVGQQPRKAHVIREMPHSGRMKG